jgi:hypothetical protein
VKEALLVDNPLARVTVATNGNLSGARMARAALEAGADRAFLMGYAYRGPTSATVGSISPIISDGRLDLRESLAMYRENDVPLDHVIVGLPAYGMTWATDGPALRASRAPRRVSERGRTVLFRHALPDPLPSGAIVDHDPDEVSARIAWYEPSEGSWFQTYYDTPETLRAKYLLAHELDLAGVGMWTLGYDGGLPGYPGLVRDTFALPVVASATIDDPLVDQRQVELRLALFDGPAPVEAVRLSNDGSTWSDWIPATGATRSLPWILAPGLDGDRLVHIQSRDAEGATSATLVASTVLDRLPPVIEGIGLREVMPGAWLVTFVASDPTGIDRVQVRWRTGTADWGRWRAVDSLAAGSTVAARGTQVSVEVRAYDRLDHVTVRRTTHVPDDRSSTRAERSTCPFARSSVVVCG